MVNTQKIKGKMTELGITQASKFIGIAQSTLNLKLNNKRSMTLAEAEKLSDILRIKDDEFGDYFFYHNCCAVKLE